jgi:hypothetical protein
MKAQMAVCPVCEKSLQVRSKLLMLDKGLGDEAIKRKANREGLPEFWYIIRRLHVDYIKPEKVLNGKGGQFVNGFFCDGCSTAFIGDDMLRDDLG